MAKCSNKRLKRRHYSHLDGILLPNILSTLTFKTLQRFHMEDFPEQEKTTSNTTKAFPHTESTISTAQKPERSIDDEGDDIVAAAAIGDAVGNMVGDGDDGDEALTFILCLAAAGVIFAAVGIASNPGSLSVQLGAIIYLAGYAVLLMRIMPIFLIGGGLAGFYGILFDNWELAWYLPAGALMLGGLCLLLRWLIPVHVMKIIKKVSWVLMFAGPVVMMSGGADITGPLCIIVAGIWFLLFLFRAAIVAFFNMLFGWIFGKPTPATAPAATPAQKHQPQPAQAVPTAQPVLKNASPAHVANPAAPSPKPEKVAPAAMAQKTLTPQQVKPVLSKSSTSTPSTQKKKLIVHTAPAMLPTTTLHKKPGDWSGRDTRKEFLHAWLSWLWKSLLFALVCGVITVPMSMWAIKEAFRGHNEGMILLSLVQFFFGIIAFIWFGLPYMKAQVRRVHDFGWSGKYAIIIPAIAGFILALIYNILSFADTPEPILLTISCLFVLPLSIWGLIVFFMCLFRDGDPGSNAYDANQHLPTTAAILTLAKKEPTTQQPTTSVSQSITWRNVLSCTGYYTRKQFWAHWGGAAVLVSIYIFIRWGLPTSFWMTWVNFLTEWGALILLLALPAFVKRMRGVGAGRAILLPYIWMGALILTSLASVFISPLLSFNNEYGFFTYHLVCHLIPICLATACYIFCCMPGKAHKETTKQALFSADTKSYCGLATAWILLICLSPIINQWAFFSYGNKDRVVSHYEFALRQDNISDAIKALKSGRLHAADINHITIGNETSLHAAIRHNSQELFDLLLKLPGINVNKHYPVQLAVKLQRINMAKQLIEHPQFVVDYKEPYSDTLIDIALKPSNGELLQLIMESPSFEQSKHTILHHACAHSQKHLVRSLLESPDININQADEEGNTALHMAAKHNESPIVKMLLAHPGIDLEPKNNIGRTPLDTARAAYNATCAHLISEAINARKAPNEQRAQKDDAPKKRAESTAQTDIPAPAPVATQLPTRPASQSGLNRQTALLWAYWLRDHFPSNDLSYMYNCYTSRVHLINKNTDISFEKLYQAQLAYINSWIQRSMELQDVAWGQNRVEIRFRFSCTNATGKTTSGFSKTTLTITPEGRINGFADESNPSQMPNFSPYVYDNTKLNNTSAPTAKPQQHTGHLTANDARRWAHWIRDHYSNNDVSYVYSAYDSRIYLPKYDKTVSIDELYNLQQQYVNRWPYRVFIPDSFAWHSNRVEIRFRYTCSRDNGHTVSGYCKTTLYISPQGRITGFADDSSKTNFPAYSPQMGPNHAF